MTGPINNDYNPVIDGTENAMGTLPAGKGGKPTASGADPRLTAAVDDTDAQNRKGRDKVREAGDKTSKYTKGLSELQDEGAKGVRSTGSGMPSMPTVPQSGQAPAPAAATAPAPAAPAMSMPSVPAPSGFNTIDPALLEALVAATQERAANGEIPTMDGVLASATSATSPQNPQPLDVSQVSLAKYPGGALSQSETAAVIDQALTINGVPNDPALRSQWHQLYQHMAAGESGRNPNALNNWDCVPLDTMILTRRGWLKHDEVRAGDQTIGYNLGKQCSEWTAITRVVHYADAPLIRLRSDSWEAACTANHRWISQPSVSTGPGKASGIGATCPERGREFAPVEGNSTAVHRPKDRGVRSAAAHAHQPESAVFRAVDQLNTGDHLLLSAPAQTGRGWNITDTEAELLGWIAGDGHAGKFRDAPRGGKKATISIAQSKPAAVERLKHLLKDVPHADCVDARPTRVGRTSGGPRHQFRLQHEWAHDLMSRVGHLGENAVAIVIGMSPSQRGAWVRGILYSKGVTNGLGDALIAQRYGTLLDAVVLALYLSGRRPRVRHSGVETAGWSASAAISEDMPQVSARELEIEDAGNTAVWCVTTELGSWTARNEQHVFLTGNSNATGSMREDGGYANSSRGMWQCIPSTFASYHMAGTSNSIYDPVASAAASMNYVMDRYQVAPTGQGLSAFMARQGVGTGGYQGY